MSNSQNLLLPEPPVPLSASSRLSLEWHQDRARILKARLAERGYDAILLTVPWNIIYFTGLWALSTERPLYALLPTGEGAAPFWFYPSLDRALVETWWSAGGAEYFDYPHADGAFPNRGVNRPGPNVDLWRWTLETLRAEGVAPEEGRVCVDRELLTSWQRTSTAVLGYELDSVGDVCVDMRIRKTPEELALTRRAYSYYDDVHVFGRDLLLAEGTNLTDHSLRTAMTDYAVTRIAPDLDLDGRPHTGVGVTIDLTWIRAGVINGYPHPNQYRYAPINRGEVVQVSGTIRVGGYGGECYRPYMVAPTTTHMEKMWLVSRDSCLLQKDQMRAGVPCAEVARKIHQLQIDAGMQDYIYHRPAHGLGVEGHQPPYLSLGDHTVLEPGMCFSVEPALFDPAAGIGINFSDMFVVQESGPALQMSRLPWTEEWCWISL